MGLRWGMGATSAGIVAATVFTSTVAVLALRIVSGAADRLTTTYAEDVEVVAALRTAAERESASGNAFLIAGDERNLARMAEARRQLRDTLASLGGHARTTTDERLVAEVVAMNAEYEAALDRAVAMRRGEPNGDGMRRTFNEQTRPARSELTRAIVELEQQWQEQLALAERGARKGQTEALAMVVGVGLLSTFVAAALAFALVRSWRAEARRKDELAALLATLERSNRDLEAFAGRVAHDVRNALSPLAITSSILQQPDVSDAMVRRASAAIGRSVERARGVVDALLAFSRADAPTDAQAKASTRVAVDAVLEELAPLIEESDAKVLHDVDDVDVRCSRALFNVILVNLVGNAVKFVRDRPERTVRISSRVIGGGCELRIDDTGPGIPAAARPRIFDPFFRVPGTRAPGTGIGLATVRRIVEAHDGRVEVVSELGVGSTFSVWLPLASSSTTWRTASASA